MSHARHQSRKTQPYVTTPLPLPLLPHPIPLARLGRRRHPWSQIFHESGVPPARPVARNHPAMEVRCGAAVSLVPASRATTATRFGLVVVFIVGAEFHVVLFVIVRAITFRNGRQDPRCADRVPQACGSKFSRPPQRSCSVGSAKLVSHVRDSACLAVRRRAGSGWRRARMKFLAVM